MDTTPSLSDLHIEKNKARARSGIGVEDAPMDDNFMGIWRGCRPALCLRPVP